MRIYSPSPIDQINRWPWWWWRCRLLSDDQAVSEFPYRLLVPVVVRCARNNRWSIECGWLYASKCREFTIIQFEIVKNCFDNEETSSFLLVVVITFPLFILSFYIILKYMCLCLCLSILYPELGFKFVLYYFYNNTNVYFLHPVAKLNWKSFSQNINCIRCQIVFKCVPLHHTPLLPFRTAKDAKGQMSVSPAKIKKKPSHSTDSTEKPVSAQAWRCIMTLVKTFSPGQSVVISARGRNDATDRSPLRLLRRVLQLQYFPCSFSKCQSFDTACDAICALQTHTHCTRCRCRPHIFMIFHIQSRCIGRALCNRLRCRLQFATLYRHQQRAQRGNKREPASGRFGSEMGKKRPTNASMFSQMSHHWHITRF